MPSQVRYSGFLRTIYDQPGPAGKIGDDAHYSILEGHDHRFGLIWDRDHDTRIIHVIERLLFADVLRPVLFIGERQATVFSVLRMDCDEAHTPTATEAFERKLDGISQSLDDPWRAVVSLPGETNLGIIQDADHKVAVYLQNICNLWDLSENDTFST